ncbi:MAG: hypothetical protein D6820_15920 [Lentisphaerae bacterium]|nr:MAG: hypothetical protein D6820_15920 [Lentisphaerota bacterium]
MPDHFPIDTHFILVPFPSLLHCNYKNRHKIAKCYDNVMSFGMITMKNSGIIAEKESIIRNFFL